MRVADPEFEELKRAALEQSQKQRSQLDKALEERARKKRDDERVQSERANQRAEWMARERLQTMRETNDGFVIAEKDLELRGPGELLGTRQTGLAGFRIADLARDAGLLPGVHDLAERLLAQQPALADRVVQRWIGTAVRYASA